MGNEYRARRLAVGLAASSVAALLGVSVAVYLRWEIGREPIPPARATQIELVLGEYERARERVERGLVPA